MLLRDPIHGLVRFEGRAEAVVSSLLATRELQRLRRVRQLGLASLVFPGAEHSRFSHALGTAFLMQRWLERMRRVQQAVPKDERLDPQAELEALAAALLHDLGHGPFSHLFEDISKQACRHERWTELLLRDSATDSHRALEGFGRGTAGRVADLLQGQHRVPYLSAAISGTLDMDRADYLLRDSHMTGVRYGLFDLDWLLEALTLGRLVRADGSEHTVLAIEGRKGLPPIESFFQARSFMFQQVYHHKAVRAAESLVRSLFGRLHELVAQGCAPGRLPPALQAELAGEEVSLGAFLDLDDAVLTAAVGEFRDFQDPLLAELAAAFLGRQLPKTLALPDEPGAQGLWQSCYERARQVACERGYHPELSIWLDVPSDVRYREPVGDTPDGLWVSLGHRPLVRLGEVSSSLREVRNKRLVRPRLVFPAALRSEVTASVKELLT